MSSSEEEVIRGFAVSDRERRMERKELKRRVQEAEDRIRAGEVLRAEEVGQREGGDQIELGMEEEDRFAEAQNNPENSPERNSPIRSPMVQQEVIDPMQLILAQLRSIQEGQIELREGQRSIREDSAAIVQQLSDTVERNAVACGKKHQANSSQIVRNTTRIAQVEVQVGKVQAQVSKENDALRKEVNIRVEEVKNTVESLEVQSGSSPRSFEYPRERRIPEELKFDGRSEKPIIFLIELKSNLGRLVHRWEVARDVIKMYLLGSAREWYILTLDELDSYATFEARFRQQYWSVTIQSNMRRKIENGSYSPLSSLTPNEYLTSQRLLAKQFVCYEDELQFVLMISRHFDDRIQEAQINGGITTIQRLSDILEAYYARDLFQSNNGHRFSSNIGYQFPKSFQQRNNSPPRFVDNRFNQPNDNRNNYRSSQPNYSYPTRNLPNYNQSFGYQNQYNPTNRNAQSSPNSFPNNRMNNQQSYPNRQHNFQRFPNNQNQSPAKPSANAQTKN
jgi:hypothetical protein